MPTEEQFSPLIAFRQAAYRCLGAARDARFELADAVLLPPSANRFAALSLCPAFRRRWPSVYAALEDGRPDREGVATIICVADARCGSSVVGGGSHSLAALVGEDPARSNLRASVDPDPRQQADHPGPRL